MLIAIGFLRRRMIVTASLLVGTMLFSLFVGWLLMERTKPGPRELRFDAVAIRVAERQPNVLEGNFLAKAVLGLAGNAKDLTFDGCDGDCPGVVTGVSLRAADPTQRLGLASLTWIAPECGPTTLLLAQGWDGFAGRLRRERGDCVSTLLATLAPGIPRELSYHPMPKKPPAALSRLSWKTSDPIELRLDAVSGRLLHGSAAQQVTSVVGRLTEPLPRLAGESDRSYCAAEKGDTVRLQADGWELADFAVSGSMVTVQATSKHRGLQRCIGPIKDRLASCDKVEPACRFDRDELIERGGFSVLLGIIGLIATLLSFNAASRPACTEPKQ